MSQSSWEQVKASRYFMVSSGSSSWGQGHVGAADPGSPCPEARGHPALVTLQTTDQGLATLLTQCAHFFWEEEEQKKVHSQVTGLPVAYTKRTLGS